MLLKKIKSYMGFKSNQTTIKGVPVEDVGTPLTTNIELSEKELQFLLITIKNGLFKGEYVELLYDLTLKLQEKYKSF
jgi:hypothetical protein|tara:strand:+ start:150 stop:380 length:231 start_codon:yes stop_codon:yes gene_type:complete